MAGVKRSKETRFQQDAQKRVDAIGTQIVKLCELARKGGHDEQQREAILSWFDAQRSQLESSLAGPPVQQRLILDPRATPR